MSATCTRALSLSSLSPPVSPFFAPPPPPLAQCFPCGTSPVNCAPRWRLPTLRDPVVALIVAYLCWVAPAEPAKPGSTDADDDEGPSGMAELLADGKTADGVTLWEVCAV